MKAILTIANKQEDVQKRLMGMLIFFSILKYLVIKYWTDFQIFDLIMAVDENSGVHNVITICLEGNMDMSIDTIVAETPISKAQISTPG